MALSQPHLVCFLAVMGLAYSAPVQTMTSSITFSLRGSTGEEKVQIEGPGGETVADDFSLSTDEHEFTVGSPFTVNFLNDNGPRDILMTMVSPAGDVSDVVDIEHPNFVAWKCGSSDEDVSRCTSARSGTFAWSGTYQVTAKEVTTTTASETTIGTTIGLTLSPQVVSNVPVARAIPMPELTGDKSKDMAIKIEHKVIPLIAEGHLNDTSLVTGQLNKLVNKSLAVAAAKSATDAADKALDACHVLENGTLHAWKVCNKSRDDWEEKKRVACDAMDEAGVSIYTIAESATYDFSYKKEGADAPSAVCNFETDLLEGTNVPCDAFVDDIKNEANSVFESQYSVYTAAEEDCAKSTGEFGNATIDCDEKGKAHRTQEEQCVTKGTNQKVKLCKFQTALISKCTTLSQFNTAVDDLVIQEERRNKELRIVSMTRCLFTRYSENQETCFKDDVMNTCTKMIDGAVAEYATLAAEKIHFFKQGAKNVTQPGNFPCKEQNITIGTSSRSYMKLPPVDEFDYYVQRPARVFEASDMGVFSPDPGCA